MGPLKMHCVEVYFIRKMTVSECRSLKTPGSRVSLAKTAFFFMSLDKKSPCLKLSVSLYKLKSFHRVGRLKIIACIVSLVKKIAVSKDQSCKTAVSRVSIVSILTHVYPLLSPEHCCPSIERYAAERF